MANLRDNYSVSIAGLHNSEYEYQVAGMRRLHEKIGLSENVHFLTMESNSCIFHIFQAIVWNQKL
jgi:hypothetical protein